MSCQQAVVAFLCAASVITSCAEKLKDYQARILVGPNILVSRDGEFPHIEYAIAAHPSDADTLIAAAMTLSGSGASIGVRTYSSRDRGNTWTFNYFPELESGRGNGSGDPQVAFGPGGTAYFLALTSEFGSDGHEIAQRPYVYRSKNGGKTWLLAARLHSCDRPSLTVDFSKGKFSGRIYISALYTKDHKQTLGLFHSDDDGRSFIGPVDVVRASGAQVSPPLVLSDGTLVFPYVEWKMGSETTFETDRILKVVVSTDGGETFSAPHQIAVQNVPGEHLVEDFKQRLSFHPANANVPHLGGVTFDWPAIPQFASNPTSKVFRDRIYAVWSDTRPNSERVLFSYSADHGKNWATPTPLSPAESISSYQFQPMVTVNKEGIVGVQWFDSRRSALQDSYDLYFTASLDGGESFLAAKRVTSQSSFPNVVSHIKTNVEDNAFREGTYKLSFGSIESGREMGDYMGLAADAAGAFHPLWADSRGSTFQMWTTRIEVHPSHLAEEGAAPETGVKFASKDVSLVLDPIRYEIDKQRLVIPVRLRNISNHTLRTPVTIVVKSVELGYPAVASAGFQSPRIMNAANGKIGQGAVFDYSAALGDFQVLEPGQMSEAIPWEFEMKEPGQALFTIQAEVKSRVP